MTSLNIAELLYVRAKDSPDAPAYISYSNNAGVEKTLSYARLIREVALHSARLVELESKSGLALVATAPKSDFVLGFFSCLVAGLTAIPSYPPTSKEGVERFIGILHDSGADIVIASRSASDAIERACSINPNLQIYYIDEVEDRASLELHPARCSGPAIIQYTSGSTSRAKGTVIAYDSLTQNLAHIRDCFRLTKQSKGVIWLPPYHDMGLVGGILAPLFVGFPVILISPRQFLQDPLLWLKCIDNERATISGGPITAFEHCVRRIPKRERLALDLSSWDVCFCGAEPIKFASLDRFVKSFRLSGFRRKAFLPCYGLAEATLIVSGRKCGSGPSSILIDRSALTKGKLALVKHNDEPASRVVSCGAICDGFDAHIVDPSEKTVMSDGCVGELWLRGKSVAKGYWRNPKATKEVFLAKLSANHEGTWLRTGDVGFFHRGELYITGRIKDLIVVGGRKIHPEDIENFLYASCPLLRNSRIIAYEDQDSNLPGVIIVIEASSLLLARHKISALSYRKTIATAFNLAVNDILFCRKGTIATTLSGKVRREATRLRLSKSKNNGLIEKLSSVSNSFGSRSNERTYKLNRIKAIEAVIGCKISPVNVGESLISLGLDSLRCAELASTLGIELSTLGDLGKLRLLDVLNTAPKRRSRTQPVREKGSQADSFDLSCGQNDLWLGTKLSIVPGAYKVGTLYEFRGPLEPSALEFALNSIIEYNEALRTVYKAESIPNQRILPPKYISLPVVEDFASDIAIRVKTELDEMSKWNIDIEKGPPIVAKLTRVSEDHFLFGVIFSHLVVDGWSCQLLARQLIQEYKAKAYGIKPESKFQAKLHYRQAIEVESAYLKSKRCIADKTYWLTKLSGKLAFVNLQCDRVRPIRKTYFGQTISARMGAHLFAEIKRHSRNQNRTLFASLLSIVKVLLHKYTGENDIIVGAPISRRDNPAYQGVVGFFANTAALRDNIDSNSSFNQVIQQCSETVSEAIRHQEIPFRKVVEALSKRGSSLESLFNVMIVLDPRWDELTIDNLRVTRWDIDFQSSKCDITFLFREEPDSTLSVRLEYDTDIFDRIRISRILDHFLVLCHSVVNSPDEAISKLGMITSNEQNEILNVFNSVSAESGPFCSISELVRGRARLSPKRLAVVAEGISIDYNHLDLQSDCAARYLLSKNLVKGDLVGVMFERSVEMIVVLIAILKAGGAYLPIDPSYPKGRIDFMLSDSGAKILITQASMSVNWFSGQWICVEKMLSYNEGIYHDYPICLGDDLAYVIYTSGSSGAPKGVPVRQESVVNLVTALGYYVEGSRVGLIASIAFDASVKQIFGALLNGGTLHLAPAIGNHGLLGILEFLRCNELDLADVTPSLLSGILKSCPDSFPSFPKRILVGGEALNYRTLARLKEVCNYTKVTNVYGPTECCVDATKFDVVELPKLQSQVPIGKPLLNVACYVVDKGLNLLPIGIPGEIVIAGVQVSNGYLRRQDLTSQVFIDDPFSKKGKMYRTGDIGMWNPDGTLQFLGRQDGQVKIRGYRIEIGEVEAALNGVDGVTNAAVMVDDSGEDQYLCGYFEGFVEPVDLERALQSKIPEFMIPRSLIRIDSLPRLPNGKIDKSALGLNREVSVSFLPPESEIEILLETLWVKILEVEDIGRNVSFFNLGGHSIKALRLGALIQETFGISLQLQDLFSAKTIEQQAVIIGKHLDGAASTDNESS